MDGLTVARAAELLERARAVEVLVVGDLMLDRYISGSVERVSPEAPVPVVRVEDESCRVGGAGNVAANIVALGAACHLVGLVGRDDAGQLLERALDELGVQTRGLIRTDERPTSQKTRILARRQQVVRVDREVETDASPELAQRIADTVRDLAGSAGVIVMEDYNKGVLVPGVIRSVIECATALGRPTVVDPKRRNFFAYEGATLFKPNAKELEDALGSFIHADDAGWMEDTRLRVGCRDLLLTLGERGMAIRTEAGESLRIPAVARGVYDVSGAGDTVTAVAAVALAAGASTLEAAMLANHAAAIEVAKPGVATVTPAELLDHVGRHSTVPPAVPIVLT